jgi:hypothetical protein
MIFSEPHAISMCRRCLAAKLNTAAASRLTGDETMNAPAQDDQSNPANEGLWEIYEISATKPFAWSWRYRIEDKIVRQGDVMHSTLWDAIDDAIAHGMEDPHPQCVIVRLDKTRISYEARERLLGL